MRKLVMYAVFGIGWGSFMYMLNLLVFHFSPTWSNAAVTWFASALMGLVTVIYQHERWSDSVKIGLHLLSIYVLVLGMLLVNQWIPLKGTYLMGVTFEFIVIYVLITAFIYWQTKTSVKRVNQKLNAQKINLDKDC